MDSPLRSVSPRRLPPFLARFTAPSPGSSWVSAAASPGSSCGLAVSGLSVVSVASFCTALQHLSATKSSRSSWGLRAGRVMVEGSRCPAAADGTPEERDGLPVPAASYISTTCCDSGIYEWRRHTHLNTPVESGARCLLCFVSQNERNYTTKRALSARGALCCILRKERINFSYYCIINQKVFKALAYRRYCTHWRIDHVVRVRVRVILMKITHVLPWYDVCLFLQNYYQLIIIHKIKLKKQQQKN